MPTRELQDILNSGEIVTISLAGTGDGNALLQKAEIDARIASGDLVDFKKGGFTAEEQLMTKAEVDAAIANVVPVDFSYNVTKVAGITVASDSFEEIARLELTGMAAGTYEYAMSWVWQINTTVNSAIFSYNVNAAGRNIMSQEAKDISDSHHRYYAFPQVLAGGDTSIIFEARKDNASDVLTIAFCDVIIKRVA